MPTFRNDRAASSLPYNSANIGSAINLLSTASSTELVAAPDPGQVIRLRAWFEVRTSDPLDPLERITFVTLAGFARSVSPIWRWPQVGEVLAIDGEIWTTAALRLEWEGAGSGVYLVLADWFDLAGSLVFT